MKLTARSVSPASAGQDAVVDLLPPRRRARLDPEQLELVRRDGRRRAPRRAPPRPARRSRRSGSPPPPKTTCDGVLLELDLGLRREAGAEQLGPDALAELGLGQEQEVLVPAPQHDERRDHARLRRSAAAPRTTRRARARRRRSRASGRGTPRRRGRRRGRRTVGVAQHASLVTVETVFRSKAEKKVHRGRLRPGPPAAGPVSDREVAGPARGLGPVDRPRHLDVRGLRRGREPGLALLGRAERAAAHRAHAGHPLRHPLVEVRHDLRGDPLARARGARPAEAERALRDRPGRAGLHVQRADRLPPRRARAAGHARRRRAARARSTAGRCGS